VRRAPKLLVKPLRWTRAQWVLVKRRARALDKGTADYVRDLVAADIEYEMMDVFDVSRTAGAGVTPRILFKTKTPTKGKDT
jgi:hypothetical protein